jgi:hypothetical protein
MADWDGERGWDSIDLSVSSLEHGPPRAFPPQSTSTRLMEHDPVSSNSCKSSHPELDRTSSPKSTTRLMIRQQGEKRLV